MSAADTAKAVPMAHWPKWLRDLCRYISDTLAEGTANERAVARTVMHMLPLDAMRLPPAGELPPLPQPRSPGCKRGPIRTVDYWDADQMQDYARAAIAAAQVPQWHPIETAPIDREDVLLWTPSGMLVGYCYARDKWHASGVKSSDEGADVELYEAPTHWMPLPAAPEQQGGAT